MKAQVVVVLALLSFFSVVMAAAEDLKTTQKRASMDASSKEDLNKFLDDILSPGKNKKPSSCKSAFEEESGVILRTSDSVKKGAEFLAASTEVQSIDECKQQCCETVSKETSRHCDFIVFQKPDEDMKIDSIKCFLFSCTNDDGEDVCLTTPNTEYSVFRIREYKVENQLLDIASNSTKKDAKGVKENNRGVCLEQFTKQSATIIRTRDSIKNGAVFLKAPSDITTLEDCQIECCTTINKSSNHCDLAVFQTSDSDPDENLPRCYLFSCTDEDGVFHCVTAPNNGYVAMAKSLNKEENELSKIVSNSGTTTNIPESSETTSIIMPSTTTTTTPKPSTTVSTSASTTTVSVSPKVSGNLRSCNRLEWQCDSGECIAVTEVCNGKTECSDKSDETLCQNLKEANPDAKTETNSKQASEKPTTSTTQSTTTTKVVTTTTTKPKLSTEKISMKTTESPIKSVSMNLSEDDKSVAVKKTEPQKGAVLPLALGLSVTICVLLMVGCRFHIMKRKLRRRGKPLSMEESDYLINGMYL